MYAHSLSRMMAFFLTTCLLPALISPASVIYCSVAYNDSGITADGYADSTCNPDGNSCVSSVLRTNIKNPEVQAQKKCLQDDFCYKGDYSFTAADGKFFEMKAQCCKTQKCNDKTLNFTVSDRNMRQENGLQCPACFLKGNTICQSEKTINCTENETQCVTFKGSYSKDVFALSHFTFKGCGTADFCAVPEYKRIGAGRFLVSPYAISCYIASPISH